MQEQINNSSMLKVGTILRETYRIDGYLSSGGFGNTYVATNIEFEERIAIKEFFMKGVTQRDENQTTVSISNAENHNDFLEQKEKFKKEARRLRKLKNDYIVNVHDLFEENGTAYYVMDYVDGENLAERLKRTGKPMTEEEVRELLPQILNALKTVHNTGIWHLDLKPANIMLTKEGQVKLIDFGASKQLNAKKGGATTSTAISYTNGYAPREQMEQNYDKFGPWTDIYALGATTYTLLTNKRPPLPTNIDDDMSEDKHNALPFPNEISKDMKGLVLAMMQTNKNKRPQNVEAIIAILSDLNQKEKEVCDALSEETIIDPKRNGTKEEQKQVFVNNKKTQIESLNKGAEKKSETKKRIKTRLLLNIAIISILGCVGWIIYHNSNDKKTLYQVNNDSEQNSIIVHDIKRNQEKVFKALKNKGYTGIGNNEIEFGKLMNKSSNRRKVYDALVQEGYTGIGKDFNEFEKLIYQEQNDNIGKLYSLLQKEGYNDIGTEKQFRQYVSDVNNAKKLHGLLEKDGYDDIGTEDQFLNWLGVEQQLTPKSLIFNPTDGSMDVGVGTLDKKKVEENKRKLYNALYNQFSDLGSFEQFSKRVQDPAKCRMLYNAIKDKYALPGFDDFLTLLGVTKIKLFYDPTDRSMGVSVGTLDKKKVEDNRKKLYNALYNKYRDLGSFEQFSKKVQDPVKCQKLYNEIRDIYVLPDFDVFSKSLGVTTNQSNQQAPKHSSYDSGRTTNLNDKTQSSIYESNKLNDLFDNLRAKGFAKDKTREEYFSYMLASCKQGYQNRKAFFDDYKSHGFTDLNCYEEFAKWLRLRPVNSILKYQFFDKDGKSYTIDKSEYDDHSDDFAAQFPDVTKRMVDPDGVSWNVPIANTGAVTKEGGYRMWLLRVDKILRSELK